MIERFLLEAFIQVVGLALIAIFLVKAKTKENYLRVLFFALIFIVYQIALVFPKLSRNFDFFESNWNWEGKTFGIILGVICYFVFRNYFVENDFFTFRQNPENKKKTWIVAISVIVLMSVLYYFIGKSDFSAETLAFQLTMPALDEEIMFRGILLGLLLTALREKFLFFGNPAILLTAILFGFLHAFGLSKDYNLSFDIISFLHTGIGGYVFAWLALRSESLVLPILTHGLTNFFAALATMLK